VHRVAIAAASSLALLSACSTPSQNFQRETEEFLNEDTSVAAQFGGAAVTGASCERPSGAAIGTTYRCTADVATEGTVTFRAQITGESSFTIIAIE